MLSPEKEGLSKHIALLCSLMVLSVAISPIASLISRLDGIEGDFFDIFLGGEKISKEDYQEIYRETLIIGGEENMSVSLKSMLSRDLEIDIDDFDVSVKLYEGDKEYLPREVTVTLYSGGILVNPHNISDYVNRLLGCECEIIYR